MLQVLPLGACRCDVGSSSNRRARLQPRIRARRVACTLENELEAEKPKYTPAYNKYRTRQQIDRDVIKEWKYITGSTSPRVPLQPWTLAFSFAGIIKYYVIPEQLRFLNFLVWSFMKRMALQANKVLILQGAKVDASIARVGNGGRSQPISRAMALKRWHGKISPWSNFIYRLQLWRGVPLSNALPTAAASS